MLRRCSESLTYRNNNITLIIVKGSDKGQASPPKKGRKMSYPSIPPQEEKIPTEEELREITYPESRGLYYVMPSEIMDSKQMKAMEKLLYMLLSGLAHKNGTCYPSDAYLAERLDVNASYVGRMVKNLESIGLINKKAVPHPKWPFRKSRLIEVHRTFKKGLRTTPQCDSETTLQCGIVSKVNSNKETTTAPAVSEDADASVVVFFQENKFSKKVQRELLKSYGADKVQLAIEYFQKQEEEIPNPVGWIKSCLKNEWSMTKKVPKTTQDRITEVKAWLKTSEYGEALRKGLKSRKVNAGHNYIEFIGVPEGYLHLGDKGAKERIKRLITKCQDSWD